MEHEIIIDRDGGARHLIDEENDHVFAPFGERVDIYRNSHVETWSSLSVAAKNWLHIDGNEDQKSDADHLAGMSLSGLEGRENTYWWADMLPTCNCVLGPFDSRAEALAAEIQLLEERHLPLPVTAK